MVMNNNANEVFSTSFLSLCSFPMSTFYLFSMYGLACFVLNGLPMGSNDLNLKGRGTKAFSLFPSAKLSPWLTDRQQQLMHVPFAPSFSACVYFYLAD
jgi:hypothetical protein